ncbi:hypothetical protein CHARACLAT_021744 [Characodon lateralis]|uniref:Uncharacterized protein n=1 Tax=Characodon lateralis TaxID=208331 RepID=A0ABU7CQB2_9TELE|nr:hypothetical protein [Characodon lateralis]
MDVDAGELPGLDRDIYIPNSLTSTLPTSLYMPAGDTRARAQAGQEESHRHSCNCEFFTPADPESQRKRTVQNVLDLRQNLEETMTSLRGVQLSHSCVEGTINYDSDEAAAFSISSLSNRSSPLSWRHGQASPRLQAGDAPSTGSAPSDIPLRISHTSRIHLIEDLVESDPSLLKGNYLSDNDLGGKNPNDDYEDDGDDDDDDIDDLGNG